MATHVHEFVGAAARTTTAHTSPRPRAQQRTALLGHETETAATFSSLRPYRRSVSCSAIKPQDFTSVIVSSTPQVTEQQQNGHDSLLHTATGTAWEYLESVRSIQVTPCQVM